MKILVVEDDAELAQALASALRDQHMVVDVASSLREAGDLAFGSAYDVLVVDRGLPDGDGLSLIERLRDARVHTPAIVLTAMIDVVERVRSLDYGADDYLGKPFARDELMARIRALGRRPAGRAQRLSSAGALSLDHEDRQVLVADRPLALPRREWLVLETLLLSKGRTVHRQRLVERVYGEGEDIQSNSLDSHVSRLRSKLDAAYAGVEIHAVRGVGYLLREATGGERG
ncbi:MAG: response regulator transcription factor [Rhodocyclaceae bacterium]|nr:response regulator transcription factor [Rhodocyclaceae bacterium]MDQ7998889.1 response regulator transcription factor [Pseudomonadota bacterium]MDQ8017039.1 response regulator transcription factor [Pseudomonadota bacterium]